MATDTINKTHQNKGIATVIKQKLTFVIVVFMLAANVYAGQDAGFDEICRIYGEAQDRKNMDREQLSAYIFDNIKQRVNVVDAIQAHSAIFNLAPAERYAIFKESAEYSLKKDWDCPAMQALMQ